MSVSTDNDLSELDDVVFVAKWAEARNRYLMLPETDPAHEDARNEYCRYKDEYLRRVSSD